MNEKHNCIFIVQQLNAAFRRLVTSILHDFLYTLLEAFNYGFNE